MGKIDRSRFYIVIKRNKIEKGEWILGMKHSDQDTFFLQAGVI